MLITSLAVLLIGVVRWFFGGADRLDENPQDAASPSTGIVGKINTLLGRSTNSDGDDGTRPPRTHTTRRQAGPPRPAGERRPQSKGASRSRHVRPPMDDPAGPASIPRRRYPDYARDDREAPSRRRRMPRDPARRATQRQREWEPMDPPARPRRPSRYEDSYDPYEPESFDPQSPPSTHHPFSNVRYRGTGSGDENRKYRRPRNA
jgi:hypothetical protein